MLTRFHRLLVAGLGLCLGSAASVAQNATPLVDFKSGPGNGLYSYASSSPATVMDLIRPNGSRPAATAQGELVLPLNAAADAKLPAVVLVHGSGGLYPELFSYWVKLFNTQGIAVLVIDVFGPRGVKSTGEDHPGSTPKSKNPAFSSAGTNEINKLRCHLETLCSGKDDC